MPMWQPQASQAGMIRPDPQPQGPRAFRSSKPGTQSLLLSWTREPPRSSGPKPKGKAKAKAKMQARPAVPAAAAENPSSASLLAPSAPSAPTPPPTSRLRAQPQQPKDEEDVVSVSTANQKDAFVQKLDPEMRSVALKHRGASVKSLEHLVPSLFLSHPSKVLSNSLNGVAG